MAKGELIMSQNLIIDTVARHFKVHKSSLKKKSEGYQNLVFEYQTLILRISLNSSRSREMIEAEIKWLQFLSHNGVSVGNPVQLNGFEMIEEIPIGDEMVYAAFFKKVEGQPVNVLDSTQWNSSMFKEWGRILGKLHALNKELQSSLLRPKWSPEHGDVFNLSKELTGDSLKKYQKLLKELKKFTPSDEVFGLIHNDFHQGNFHVAGGRIDIFDFDDCAYNWFANDIAVSLYHACWQQASFHNDPLNEFPNIFLSAFLEGYKIENTITDTLLKQIPLFLKIRDIFLFSLFKREWDIHNLEYWQAEKLAELKENILAEKSFITIKI